MLEDKVAPPALWPSLREVCSNSVCFLSYKKESHDSVRKGSEYRFLSKSALIAAVSPNPQMP